MTTEKAGAHAPRSFPPDEPGGPGRSAGPPAVRGSASPPARALPSPPTTDTAVLGRIAAGDRAALGELYDRFAVRVYSLARGVCGDDGVAAEVQQTVFGAVWSSVDGFDPALGPVASWLLDLTHGKAVDALRHRGPGRRPDPEPTEQVRATLVDLSPAQLRVLTTTYYGGRSCHEVASLLGIPAAAVGVYAADAVARLRPPPGPPAR